MIPVDCALHDPKARDALRTLAFAQWLSHYFSYAVMMAVWRRRPQQTLIHSDQGSQERSDDWLRFCRE
jgi:hypothetical protein